MCKVMEEYGNLCENRGRKEGREEAIIELALKMLRTGFDSKEKIASLTELPLEKIEELALQLDKINA